MLLILFGCLPEVKLGPQTCACAVTFVYVVAETVVEENSFYADLRGRIGPKCKGSKAVQRDLVECYLLPLQVRKNTAARL